MCEVSVYYRLTKNPGAGHRIIGAGEAAAIAMAKEYGGILASNNLRDILDYVREFNLIHVTTGSIMKEAMLAGYIDEAEGNMVWKNMLRRKRKLGYNSFSDYLMETR